MKQSHLIQYLAAVSGSFGAIATGMHAGWPSPSLHRLLSADSPIPITNEEGSWLAVIYLIGCIIGSVTATLTAKYLGRKTIITLASIPLFLGWLLISLAQSVTILYIARLIAGTAEGALYSAFPMYCGEISDPKIRGLISSATSAAYVLGFLLINTIGLYLSIADTALISSAVPVCLFVTFIWLPESPYYLLTKDRAKEAKRCLQRFRRNSNVDVELDRIQEAIKMENKRSQTFTDLFKVKCNIKTLLLMVLLRAVQQSTGATPITLYAKTIFAAGGGESSNASTIIFFGTQLCLSLFTSAIVDKAGRRPLLILSMSGAGLSLFVEGIYFYVENCTGIDTSSFGFVQVAALMAFIFSLSLGLQTVPLLMFSEVFATDFKPYALCIISICYSIVASSLSKFFQITKDTFGIHVPFFAFTGCCVAGVVFIIFCIPETKGKTLEDIQAQLTIKKTTTSKENCVEKNEK